MDVTTETLHVVIGLSTAATLRKALLQLGRTERVVGLADSLSVGPIDPPDPKLRLVWSTTVLRGNSGRRGEHDKTLIDDARAWAEATAPSVHPVFWACLSSPMEHAGYLAFAARMEHRLFDIVDATGLDFTTTDGVRSPWSLGFLRAHDFLASNLLERRRPVPAEERRAAANVWSELVRENAPFRIVQEGRLVSAPLTHYDAVLVELASCEWEVAPRLVGRAMDRLSFGTAPTGQDVGDASLFGRMLALGESGALEIAGSGPGMRHYQVRRLAV